jgi:hypothetical protein
MNYLRLELKVCEGCGALWIRPVNDGVYCRPCLHQLVSFPAPKAKHVGGRPRRSGRVSKRCSNGRFAGGSR